MEKVKVTEETFDNILAMLNSKDQENVILGLSCIEELDISSGLVYLLLLKKLGNVTTEMWREYAPKKLMYLSNLNGFNGGPSFIPSYREILQVLQKVKVPLKDIKFYLVKFGNHMAAGLREDYAVIDNIEITVKLKLHDG